MPRAFEGKRLSCPLLPTSYTSSTSSSVDEGGWKRQYARNLPLGEIDGRATRNWSTTSSETTSTTEAISAEISSKRSDPHGTTTSGERPAVEISMIDVFPGALTRALTRMSVNGGDHRSS